MLCFLSKNILKFRFDGYIFFEKAKIICHVELSSQHAVETSNIFVKYVKNDKLTAFVRIYEIIRLYFVLLNMKKQKSALAKRSVRQTLIYFILSTSS